MTRTALVTAALLAALNGGVFFAFSDFVMRALDRLGPTRATEAFNSINVTVLTPTFMTLLFGTALVAAGAAVMAFRGDASPWLATAGAAGYVVGCVGVTLFGNVPLNDALAAAAPMEWRSFYPAWMLFNHARTIACVASSISFAVAAISLPAR